MRTNTTSWLAIPILALFGAIACRSPNSRSGAGCWASGNKIAPGSAETEADHGVARVSFIRGDVTMQRGDSGDFSAVA